MSDAERIVVKYDTDFSPGSGVCTQLAWHGSLLEMLNSGTYSRHADEYISGLVIDQHGITVYFNRRQL